MRIMAQLLQSGRTADGVMQVLSRKETDLQKQFAMAGRNDPCPCGAMDEAGKPIKYKKCHGK
jgi:uncharacterized protein YecA (UPF0149 family)